MLRITRKASELNVSLVFILTVIQGGHDNVPYPPDLSVWIQIKTSKISHWVKFVSVLLSEGLTSAESNYHITKTLQKSNNGIGHKNAERNSWMECKLGPLDILFMNVEDTKPRLLSDRAYLISDETFII